MPDVFFGDGLQPDPQENWINNINNDIGYESIDEIAYSSSIGEVETNYLISQSEYGYPNLNTNFKNIIRGEIFCELYHKITFYKHPLE